MKAINAYLRERAQRPRASALHNPRLALGPAARIRGRSHSWRGSISGVDNGGSCGSPLGPH
jgi:hypothetical protein